MTTFEVDPVVVSHTTYAKVLEHIRGTKKIAAIKELRNGWSDMNGRSLHLRDAKFAVERLMDEIEGKQIAADGRPRVITSLYISGVELVLGNEKVHVDLEELQLRILSDIGTIGLAECGRILELVEMFQAWNKGLRVGVIGDD